MIIFFLNIIQYVRGACRPLHIVLYYIKRLHSPLTFCIIFKKKLSLISVLSWISKCLLNTSKSHPTQYRFIKWFFHSHSHQNTLPDMYQLTIKFTMTIVRSHQIVTLKNSVSLKTIKPFEPCMSRHVSLNELKNHLYTPPKWQFQKGLTSLFCCSLGMQSEM